MTNAISNNTASPFRDLQDLRSGRNAPAVEAPKDGAAIGAAAPTEALESMTRLTQLGELAGMTIKKKAQERLAELAQLRIDNYEKMLANPPQPEVELTGKDAASVVELARKRAAEVGHSFPPAKDESFGFISGEWFYTVGGDGRVTRRDKDVLTPEQWEQTNEDLQKAKAFESSGIREAEMSELDKQIEALRAEVGPVTEEELSKMNSDFASFFSVLV